MSFRDGGEVVFDELSEWYAGVAEFHQQRTAVTDVMIALTAVTAAACAFGVEDDLVLAMGAHDCWGLEDGATGDRQARAYSMGLLRGDAGAVAVVYFDVAFKFAFGEGLGH